MNGETTQYLAEMKQGQRKQKPGDEGDEGPDKKKIKLGSPHDAERSSPSPTKQSMLNTLHVPHVNSVLNQVHGTSPLNRSMSAKILNSPGIAIKREVLTPVKQSEKVSRETESDDDDIPLAARAIAKHSAVKVKSEPAQSALNSVIKEEAKSPGPGKLDKAKNGKTGKPEKKGDKKVDSAKKKKPGKKAEGTKMPKKAVESDDDDLPLASNNKTPKTPIEKKKIVSSGSKSSGQKANASVSRKRKKNAGDVSNSDEEESKPLAKSAKKVVKKTATKGEKGASAKKKVKKEEKDVKSDKEEKGKKKKEEEKEVWKWWEEEQLPEGVKWLKMEHKGPYFPPVYEPLPASVKFYYDGQHVKLSLEAEEVASFYAKMLDHDYTSKPAFNKNFFEDWRKEMTAEERKIIKDLTKCNFKEMNAYFVKDAASRIQ